MKEHGQPHQAGEAQEEYPSLVLWPEDEDRLVLRPCPRWRYESKSFRMGSRDGTFDAEPVHAVSFPGVSLGTPGAQDGELDTQLPAFWMAEAPITEAQFLRWDRSGGYQEWLGRLSGSLLEENGRFTARNRPTHPVVGVTWWEASAFAKWLNEEGTPRWLSDDAGKVAAGDLDVAWSLPGEAHWEFACRAGTSTEYSSGDGEAALNVTGWWVGNSGGTTHPVKDLHPNDWQLHDMHGNVAEWCLDEWDPHAYRRRRTGPIDAIIESQSGSSSRVLRGGGWWYSAGVCRSAYRFGRLPGLRFDDLGFRVCLLPGPAVSSPGGGAPAKERAET